MKIFYAVQATGNGHISRAMELLPYLEKYGTVDIFLSGDNSHLNLDAPVKYRSKGISLFYNCKGGLDFWHMLKGFQPLRIREEIRDLPVEKYDLVLNDFDYITSAACAKKKIPSIHFGHQASFLSPHTPRPAKKQIPGEWLLKNFIRATHHIGLHFKSYDDFIFPAIIKKEILQAEPVNGSHITVYLPSYCEPRLEEIFFALPDFQFHIFSKEAKSIRFKNNILFLPVDRSLFNQSLISCSGIITGGGFETPAEALHLGKRIMTIPIKGQYEQLCNAAAIAGMGAINIAKIDGDFANIFYNWIGSAPPAPANYRDVIPYCLERIFCLAEQSLQQKAA